jgi:hypothetical protein
MATPLRSCFCSSRNCNGKQIHAREYGRHQREDEEKRRKKEECAQQNNSDKFVNQVFRMTLNSNTSPESKSGGAIWERDSRNPEHEPSTVSSNATLAFTNPVPGPPGAFGHPSGVQALYSLLLSMDQEIQQHIVDVSAIMSKPVTPDDLLRKEEHWFHDVIHKIRVVNPGGDKATSILREAMLDRVLSQHRLIEAERKRRGHLAAENTPENIFNSGEQLGTRAFGHVNDDSPAEKYFHHPLRNGNPLVLISMFLVVVLNVFGHVARPSCNFALRMLKCLVQCALQQSDGQLTNSHEQLLKDFPTDIRSVRRAFDIEPTMTIYATCPKCCFTHKPTRTKSGIDVYPSRCQYVRYKGHRSCGTRITKQIVQNGHSVRSPIRPFAYHSFPAFVAGLISRPGMEDILDRAWQGTGKDEIRDVWDATATRELVGVDGRPFSITVEGEARLAWCLSIDWFNPYHNKAAGKAASVGSMAMTCLNLPPSLRYKPENIYPNIIPGPREPQTDQINHFLRPLVDDLELCWTKGTWYTKTHRHPEGRRVFSAICHSVNDLPGARKTGGGMGTSSGWISPFYTSQRRSDINNTDITVSISYFGIARGMLK